jgi:hypothetical protein
MDRGRLRENKEVLAYKGREVRLLWVLKGTLLTKGKREIVVSSGSKAGYCIPAENICWSLDVVPLEAKEG